METLHQGSRAIPVRLLQRLLNKKRMTAAPPLREDGIFGGDTRAAVVAFQTRERIAPDGIVGPTTWARLGLTIDITHPVTKYGQPTDMTCWSAAATMILGGNLSVGPGRATLSFLGGLEPAPHNVEVFGRGLGWRMYYPQTWTVRGLAELLRRKPAWAVGGGTTPKGGWLHAIVLSGLWSDGAEDGSGTMLRIHDPWPPGVGNVYGRFFHGTVDGFDFISLYILQPN
jgi:hypothetical protein